MKAISTVLFAAALGGVSALPSGHSLVARDQLYYNAVHTVTTTSTAVVDYSGPTQAPAPEKPKEQKKENPSPDYSSPTPSKGDGKSKDDPKTVTTYQEFCNGKQKRATTADIFSVGNTGRENNYGCNWMLVASEIASKYKYRMAVKNALQKSQKCACYNKIGPDGGVNGFTRGNHAIYFTLEAGQERTLAIEKDTQGGCSCFPGELTYDVNGILLGSWVEIDAGSKKNDGWSGADASCLTAADANASIPATKVCGHGTCSTIYAGGKGENAYLKGDNALDGVGLNIDPSQGMNLRAVFG